MKGNIFCKYLNSRLYNQNYFRISVLESGQISAAIIVIFVDYFYKCAFMTFLFKASSLKAKRKAIKILNFRNKFEYYPLENFKN